MISLGTQSSQILEVLWLFSRNRGPFVAPCCVTRNRPFKDLSNNQSHQAELIFVTNITNYIFGEKIVIWKILGNFGRFCHNLRAFMWRKIKPKKYICGEKMTNMRSATKLTLLHLSGVLQLCEHNSIYFRAVLLCQQWLQATFKTLRMMSIALFAWHLRL